ncbi:MAG: PaaX family transcriptional regulator C-terminal domain-containing protein [Candidatus Promineifilaceae bacterium]
MTRVITTEARPVRTQFLVFTLFGEYVVQRGGKVWTSSLLYLMGLLGVSERAVRSTLSRMSQKGWIATEKRGRRSRYYVTARGYALLDEGQRRIFEPVITEWDGQWHIVLYSLPEEIRRRRHALRTKLSWLGFGRLAPSTWISPHDRGGELKSVFDDLLVEPYIDLFSGVYLGPESSEDLASRCWDIAGLDSQYKSFIAHYEPEYTRFQAHENAGHSFSEEECFSRRFWLTHEFQSFPLRDPNLPTALLEPEWTGFKARKLFDDYRHRLEVHVNDFVDRIVCGDGYING